MCTETKDAGAPEIETTPEMVSAGLSVLWQSGAVEYPTELDREVVRKVFVAMMLARSFSNDHPSRPRA